MIQEVKVASRVSLNIHTEKQTRIAAGAPLPLLSLAQP